VDTLCHQLENLKLKVDAMEDGMEANMEGMTNQENSKDLEEASLGLDLDNPTPMDISSPLYWFCFCFVKMMNCKCIYLLLQ